MELIIARIISEGLHLLAVAEQRSVSTPIAAGSTGTSAHAQKMHELRLLSQTLPKNVRKA